MPTHTTTADEALIIPQSLLEVTPKLCNEAEWPWTPAKQQQKSAAAAAAAARENSSESDAATSTTASVCHEVVDSLGKEASEAILTFEEDLWDRFEWLWHNRVEPSQRMLEHVIIVLRSRALLERRYGENLVACAPNMQGDFKDTSVHRALRATMLDFRNSGLQSLELASLIDQDVITTLETVATQHLDVGCRIYGDVQLLAKNCNERRQAHEKIAKQYGICCSEAELAAKEYLLGAATRTSERLRAAQRVAGLSKQARVVEHEYYASIEQVNCAQALYDEQMTHVLHALQDMDQKREQCLADALMKLSIFQTSWLRNLQYDTNTTADACQKANAYADLQDFIRQHKSQERRQHAMTKLEPQPFFRLTGDVVSTPILPSNAPSTWQLPGRLVVSGQQPEVSRLLNEEIEPMLSGLLHAGPPGIPPEAAKAHLERVRQGLSDPRRRAAMCLAFRQELMGCETQSNGDLDLAKPLTITPAALDSIAGLFRTALDSCNDQNDVWCGRDIMVLTQLFLIDGSYPQEPTPLLMPRLYDHMLWSRISFWEELLLVGLCEAHAAEAVWRRVLPAGSRWPQPSMTAFLERFMGYMMAFGIGYNEARGCVQTTLQKHASLLGSGSVHSYSSLLLRKYEELMNSTVTRDPSPLDAPTSSAGSRTGTTGR